MATSTRSWAPEIFNASKSKWKRSGLRFRTKVEAQNEATAMAARTKTAIDPIAVSTDDPVNSRWDFEGHGAVAIRPGTAKSPIPIRFRRSM